MHSYLLLPRHTNTERRLVRGPCLTGPTADLLTHVAPPGLHNADPECTERVNINDQDNGAKYEHDEELANITKDTDGKALTLTMVPVQRMMSSAENGGTHKHYRTRASPRNRSR